MRIQVVLACSECHGRNYFSDKNKSKHPDRFEKVKFCPLCKKRTNHREEK